MKYMIIACMIACGMAASVSAQQFLFEDDFSDNRNQWPEWQDEKSSASVKDGKYILRNHSENDGFSVFYPVSIDLRQDFEIQIDLNKVRGSSGEHRAGISWLNKEEIHIFYIDYNGWWGYNKWNKEKKWQDILRRKDTIIKQTLNRSNALSLKKSGGNIQFFINNQSVGKIKFKGDTSNILMISFSGKTTIEIDSLKIKYVYKKGVSNNKIKPIGQPLDALARAELEKYAQSAAAATATPTPVPTALPTSTPTPVVTAIEPTPTPLPLATATPVPTLAPTAAPTLAEKKLALLIGNGAYPDAPLQNPANDARAMAAALKRLGFDVIIKEDAGQKEMKQTIDQFGQALKDYDVGVFFYSGHGVQVSGQNYLIPVDADPKSVNDVEYDCVNAGRVLGKMEDAGNTTNIIILDACRNNPFERSWTRSAQGNGLAFMNAPSGSLIAYATSPGNVAYDATEGVNSPYTAALLQHLETPNISILEMFQRVRGVVMKATDKQQIPWESTSLMGNFYFNPK